MVAKRHGCGNQSMLYAMQEGPFTWEENGQPVSPKRKSSYNLLIKITPTSIDKLYQKLPSK